MSEYGRGYMTCLLQFWNHRARLLEITQVNTHMREINPGDAELFSEQHAVHLWMNGASDHLNELRRPEGLAEDVWARAQALAEDAMDIGHGRGLLKSYTSLERAMAMLDEAHALIGDITTLKAAMAWDRAHGLRPDPGGFRCPENLSRTRVEAGR